MGHALDNRGDFSLKHIRDLGKAFDFSLHGAQSGIDRLAGIQE